MEHYRRGIYARCDVFVEGQSLVFVAPSNNTSRAVHVDFELTPDQWQFVYKQLARRFGPRESLAAAVERELANHA